MTDWIARHSSEILLVVITAVVMKGVDYLFAKRAKVVWFYTNSAAFLLPPRPGQPQVTVYTYTLALQNLGGAPAEEVKVVHNWLAPNYQVFPPQAITVQQLPGGKQAIVLPRILPGQLVFIAYLDYVPPLAQMFSHVETLDHIATTMNVQINRRFPMWANWVFAALMLMGAIVTVRFIYLLAAAVLRLLDK